MKVFLLILSVTACLVNAHADIYEPGIFTITNDMITERIVEETLEKTANLDCQS